MGAWGAGFFEDDTALDFMEEELLPSSDPKAVMRKAFESALAAEYVEYELGHAVLVSAAAIAALRTGKALEEDEEEEWAEWRAANAGLNTSDLSDLASQACKKVASGSSELNELWAENEELYPQWQAGVSALASSVVG